MSAFGTALKVDPPEELESENCSSQLPKEHPVLEFRFSEAIKVASTQELPESIVVDQPILPAPASENVMVKNASRISSKKTSLCLACHVPYSIRNPPFQMDLVKCAVCQQEYVPELLLASIEPPKGLGISSNGQFVQARVMRTCKKLQGESHALAASEAIPFMEFDLHAQLMHKLRLLGMNAGFDLKISVSIGSTMMFAVASCNAVFLPGLPLPEVLTISRNIEVNDAVDQQMFLLQERLTNLNVINRDLVKDELSAWLIENCPDPGGVEVKEPTTQTLETYSLHPVVRRTESSNPTDWDDLDETIGDRIRTDGHRNLVLEVLSRVSLVSNFPDQ